MTEQEEYEEQSLAWVFVPRHEWRYIARMVRFADDVLQALQLTDEEIAYERDVDQLSGGDFVEAVDMMAAEIPGEMPGARDERRQETVDRFRRIAEA